MNQIVVSGNLTKDPKRVTIKTDSGKKKGLAITIADSKNENEVIFWDALLFEKKADFVQDNFKKGSHITICGRAEFSVTTNDEEPLEFYENAKIVYTTAVSF